MTQARTIPKSHVPAMPRPFGTRARTVVRPAPPPDNLRQALVALAWSALALMMTVAFLWFGPQQDAGVTASAPVPRITFPNEPMMVMGANISAQDQNAPALLGALRQQFTTLPWDNALILHARNSGSVFLPVRNIRDAYALCSKLAHTTAACAPAVTSTRALRHVDGRGVSRASLAGFGVAPRVERKPLTWWRVKTA